MCHEEAIPLRFLEYPVRSTSHSHATILHILRNKKQMLHIALRGTFRFLFPIAEIFRYPSFSRRKKEKRGDL